MSRDLSPEGARRMLGMHAAALRWPGNDAGGAAPGMGAPVSVASRSFVPRGQRPRGGLYLPAARLASAALEGRAGRFEGSLLVAFRGSGGVGTEGTPLPDGTYGQDGDAELEGASTSGLSSDPSASGLPGARASRPPAPCLPSTRPVCTILPALRPPGPEAGAVSPLVPAAPQALAGHSDNTY